MDGVKKAAVIGAGSWGTALAAVATHHAETVVLWGRDASVAEAVTHTHENPRYLPGVRLDGKVRGTVRIEEALTGADIVIIAVPTKAIQSVLGPISGLLPQGVPIVSTSKGLTSGTLHFPSKAIAIATKVPEDSIFVLSGPSFAAETARGLPTAVTFAGRSLAEAERWGRLFFTPNFRTYPSKDKIGVEAAGAFKNVIAVAAGLCDGLKLGTNATSALITRGLAEITRMGLHLGADPLTFLGLSGMGDLTLTCTGGLSRNRRLGQLLAAGRSLEEAQRDLGQVAEGVFTTASAREMAERNSVYMPICGEVYKVLFEGKDPRRIVEDLMGLPMRPEIESTPKHG